MQSLSQTTEIKSLATEIRGQHQLVGRAIAAGLTHAIECGRLLLQAKNSLPHGQYLPFVTNKCLISRSTAAGYIRAYENRDRLQEMCNAVAPLSFRRALALLAEPRPRPTPEPARGSAAEIREHLDELMLDEAEDRAQLAELQRTLDRGDATVVELQHVIDTAEIMMARAIERRHHVDRVGARFRPTEADIQAWKQFVGLQRPVDDDAAGEAPDAIPTIPAMLATAVVNGRTVYASLNPYTDPAYIYCSVITDPDEQDTYVDSTRRPIRIDFAFDSLERWGFPVRKRTVHWRFDRGQEPWSYNQFLCDSHDDWMKRGVLGGEGFVDHPAIAVSPDEHKAFIERCSTTAAAEVA